MTTIKGYASMIEETEPGAERAREYARLIGAQANRLNAMVEEVLDFTRGERPDLRLAPVAVDELARRLEGLLERQLAERGIRLRCQLDYRGPLVVDRDRFERALANVAQNGLEAMAAGGTLTLGTRVVDGSVEISLLDTGPGIPARLQPLVFEPFFTHGKPRGIGLGMSITRRIVEEHGGEVRLACPPGGGTCVTLRLPLPAAP